MLDSGATVSVIHLSIVIRESRNRITTAGLTAPIEASGAPMNVVGQISMSVSFGNFTIEQVFAVVNAH